MPTEMLLYKNNFVYLISKGGEYGVGINEYKNIHILSDLFNDTCRSMCAFSNNISPYEYFMKNKENLISTNKKELRDIIWSKHPECSNHSPTIIKYFINKYKAKNVLDMCAGWGDRLIGALACGVNLYVGVDPNPCVHPNYANMISTLIPHSPNPTGKYKLYEERFEDIDITKYNETFDLMYSSPPYFDYEKYTDKPGQSHRTFTHQTEWVNGFLKPSIIKCIQALKYNGYLVLYFSQEKGKSYIEPFLQWILYVADIYYIGCMHYTLSNNKKYTHPIFIFKKSKDIPKTILQPKIKIQNKNNIYHFYNNGFDNVKQIIKWLKQNKTNKISIKCNKYSILIAYALCLLKMSDIKLYCYLADNIYQSKIKFYHPNTHFT